MLSLQDKYYGLSLLSWLIILVLVIVFIFTMFPSNKSIETTETNEKFSDTKTKEKINVYNFNTESCGYSVRFQPEWNKFEEEIKAKNNLSNVSAYDVKCDDPANEQMCMEYQVPGFPTVIVEKGKNKKVFQGGESVKTLIETIEKMQN
jgi:thiol-disulfide isomerase/thioredoxin